MAKLRVLPFGTLEFLRGRVQEIERELARIDDDEEGLSQAFRGAVENRFSYVSIILNMAEDVARKPSGGKASDVELILSAVKYLKALNVNEGKQKAAHKRGDHQHEGASRGSDQPTQRRIPRASLGH